MLRGLNARWNLAVLTSAGPKLRDKGGSAVTTWMNVSRFLESLRGELVYYKPNPGNGGDALIAEATYQHFDRLGLPYRVWEEGRDVEGAVVVFGGGGNLTPLYTHAARFLACHHRRAKRLVLLPHTIDGHEELLSGFGRHVDVFCREHRSYEHVRRFAPEANVHLGEDMALSLDLQRLANELREEPAAPFLDRRLARRTRRLRRRAMFDTRLADLRVLGGVTEDRVAHCFRRDVEQTQTRLPLGNFDLSRRTPIDGQLLVRQQVRHGCAEFLGYLDRFDTIKTNRLHVAIGGALLGKSVFFYPNSYWKNRSIYEASLRDRFPKLCWAGPSPDAPGSGPSETP